MDRIELVLAGTRSSPRSDVFPLGGVFDDARVPIAVRDVERPVRAEGEVGGTVEAVLVQPGLALVADGPPPFAFAGELHDGVMLNIRRPDILVTVDAQAVRRAEHPAAPRANVIPFGVEDHDRVGLVAAVKDVDKPVVIRRNRRNTPELPAGWHRIGFFTEPDIHPVLEKAAFMGIPTLLSSQRREQPAQQTQA